MRRLKRGPRSEEGQWDLRLFPLPIKVGLVLAWCPAASGPRIASYVSQGSGRALRSKSVERTISSKRVGKRTNTTMACRTASSTAHHVPRSMSVYSPSLLAVCRAWNGKSTNRWYQGEYGCAHGVWPMTVQIRDSAILAADLSYRERKRTGSLLDAVSMAARKIWANRP